ncbi:MAG: YggS family pyridoxal phosphate-dependent enzyme [Dehalococcoidia bacterium]|nr:YggS family pyridoxal phosphate-dependent enzyme [Dehalococcoidia bacterium]
MIQSPSSAPTETPDGQITANVAGVMRRIAHAAERAGRPPDVVTLVAVSKTFSAAHVAAAHQAGLRHFGENWIQEAAGKLPALAGLSPRPVWHMIGHLQTNKVKQALELFDLIESVDSTHLGEAIAHRAGDRSIPVLLEVNVGGEPSKHGFRPAEVATACATLRQLPQLEVRGLMTVAPEVDDPEQARPVFRELRRLRDELGLAELSMGMTGDFEVAIQEGATLVRLGRAIFGARPAVVAAG